MRALRRGGLLMLLLLALGWLWQEWQALLAFPRIISAYSAKEYCSCRYVMGHDGQYCRAYVKQYIPLSALHEDLPLRQITATGLGQRSTAAWLGPQQGCRLLARDLSPGT